MDINSCAILNNGTEIPLLGLGTWQSKAGKETYDAVQLSLELGYRHIDTAAIYGNEFDVGKAIKESGIGADEIFVTTKVWNTDQGYDNTLRAFEESTKKLGLDYVDLYLIHWPMTNLRKDTWKALIHIYETRGARSIGLSNYTEKHIAELLLDSPIQPTINQIEITPYLYQKDLVNYCFENKILIEAYSPLIRGRKFDDKRLQEIASNYNKSMAQILIRWSLQKGFVVLPKSVNPIRMKENADVFDFEINENDMMILDSFNENYRVAWDPTTIE